MLFVQWFSGVRRAAGSWLAFAGLVLVLVALHVGVLWRALAREEEIVDRSVRAELRQSARALEATLNAGFAEAERALEQGAQAPPACAVALRRGDDGATLVAGRPVEHVATMSPTCESIGLELAIVPDRKRLVATILRDCPLARGASGSLLVPALAAAHDVTDAEWTTWHEAHRDPPDAVAVRRLESVIAALSLQAAHEREARMLRVDVPEGRVRVRREQDGYGGFLETPASLVRSLAPIRADDLELRVGEHAEGSFHEPVTHGPFALHLSLANPSVLNARSAKSRGLVLGLSLASLALALGTSFVLLRRMRRLRHENELRVDFVAAVSHELRTPLASIRLLSDLLRRDDLPAEDRAEAFASLDESARHLTAQTERWLTLARLGKDGLAARRQPGDLAESVRGNVHRARNRGQDVELDAPEHLAFAFDPFLVDLIVDNLLENAAKYAPGKVHLALARSDGGVSLTCTDRGKGFPANAARLLLPFERGDLRLHQATEGVGLGLSLVNGAARAHGGHVALGSAPEGGARILVTMENAS